MIGGKFITVCIKKPRTSGTNVTKFGDKSLILRFNLQLLFWFEKIDKFAKLICKKIIIVQINMQLSCIYKQDLHKCQITNSVECCHSEKSHQQKETNTFVKSAMKGQISPGYRLFDQNILQPGMWRKVLY